MKCTWKSLFYQYVPYYVHFTYDMKIHKNMYRSLLTWLLWSVTTASVKTFSAAASPSPSVSRTTTPVAWTLSMAKLFLFLLFSDSIRPIAIGPVLLLLISKIICWKYISIITLVTINHCRSNLPQIQARVHLSGILWQLHYITLHYIKSYLECPKSLRTARTLYEIKGVMWENI